MRKVNEISTSTSLEQQIDNLTLVVQQLAMGGTKQVMRCGICLKNGHPTDSCPTLYEEGNSKKVNTMGRFQGQNGFQRKYDPFSNIYNPRWRDHPNLSYRGNQQAVATQCKCQPSSWVLSTKVAANLLSSTEFRFVVG